MDAAAKTIINYKKWWQAPSVRSLILTNILVIVIAIVDKWSVSTLVMTYWFQSIIIGLFQAKKMMDLKTFSTKDVEINGRPVAGPSKGIKRFIVGFFIFHYGFFHLIYLIFLKDFIGQNPEQMSVLIGAAVFFVNHWLSYRSNREQDAAKTQNIGAMMFYPYARIIPMHLFILFGGLWIGGTFSLIFFLILKTAADVIMHLYEHKFVAFARSSNSTKFN